MRGSVQKCAEVVKKARPKVVKNARPKNVKITIFYFVKLSQTYLLCFLIL